MRIPMSNIEMGEQVIGMRLRYDAKFLHSLPSGAGRRWSRYLTDSSRSGSCARRGSDTAGLIGFVECIQTTVFLSQVAMTVDVNDTASQPPTAWSSCTQYIACSGRSVASAVLPFFPGCYGPASSRRAQVANAVHVTDVRYRRNEGMLQ
jgi:hypothetical protein